MLDNASATQLRTAYSALDIPFEAGNNPFIIEDASAPGGVRQIVQGELILLSIPQDSIKCKGWGSAKAIPNQYVLTEDEISQINSAITDYNSTLESLAVQKELAFVDVNSFMNVVKTGIMYNGVNVNAQFVSGGAFSLDGVHLTPRGNALLANEYIKAINSKYGSTIPHLDGNKYRGVVFP
jgi:hypothetical protein